MPLESAAIITIKDAPAMSRKGRCEIAQWMRRQATFFVQHGERYADGTFRARFLYERHGKSKGGRGDALAKKRKKKRGGY